jgi:hypothetical protein
MGLLDQLGGMLGGGGGGNVGDLLGRIAGGGGNVHDPHSDDARGFHQMVSGADPNDLRSLFSQAAKGVDPQEYRDHVTPGVNGTDPLGSLGQGPLGMVAGALVRHLTGGGTGGSGASNLLGMIPGLRQQDPGRMDPHDVAALADYARRNNPDAFGAAAAEVGRQQPSLLGQLLGNTAVRNAAMQLASKYLGGASRMS